MENVSLGEQLLTEQMVMNLLGLTKKQLNYLRNAKGFPCVCLTRRARVYLAGDILEYVKRLSFRARFGG